MKWMKKFTTLLRLFVFLLLSVFFCSCGIIRKKTITKTVTEIKIDTIIKVHIDTIFVIDSLPLKDFLQGDTLKTENKIAEARAFYNVRTQKVEIELKGKVFDLPVTIDAKQTVIKKEVEPKKNKWYIFFIAGFFICLILILILKK